MDEKELLLFTVKQYIERFMFEGSKYHIIEQDKWVKQLFNIVKQQQEEIDQLKRDKIFYSKIATADVNKKRRSYDEEKLQIGNSL